MLEAAIQHHVSVSQLLLRFAEIADGESTQLVVVVNIGVTYAAVKVFVKGLDIIDIIGVTPGCQFIIELGRSGGEAEPVFTTVVVFKSHLGVIEFGAGDGIAEAGV